MSEKVQSRHTDGTPKHLHIPILEEGIYEVLGQPKLSGSYTLYLNGKGTCPTVRWTAKRLPRSWRRSGPMGCVRPW